MDDSLPKPIVKPTLLDTNIAVPAAAAVAVPAVAVPAVAVPARLVRSPVRQLVPTSIVQKMVERPVTTAAIFILLGAFAAEGIALLFARAQARTVLQRSAIRNLQLAQELDPHHDHLS